MSEGILKIDVDANRIKQTVYSLYHSILQDYVARHNEQDVLHGLYKFYTESDLALISKAQLKQYQEMEKLIVDRALSVPRDGLFPNG